MLLWMCVVVKLDKIKTERITKVGGNRKESPGTEVEVVWACDVKRGALRRKEAMKLKLQGRSKKGRPKRRLLVNHDLENICNRQGSYTSWKTWKILLQ